MYDDNEDGYVEPEPEEQTLCDECEEPLDTPVLAKPDAFVGHPECDPKKPPRYWFGPLTANGKSIDKTEGESFRRLKNMAEEVVDYWKEWEDTFEDVYVSLDGKIVPAAEWADDPATVELAEYSVDNYRGRGEYDPDHPDRCWLGQKLPSGRMARPLAHKFDSVDELARRVTSQFASGQLHRIADRLAMLPGGELVDAHDWAQQTKTRLLAGLEITNRVRYRATATCPRCGAMLAMTVTRPIEGHLGEEVKIVSALWCATCEEHVTAEHRYATISEDDSAESDGTARDLDDDLDTEDDDRDRADSRTGRDQDDRGAVSGSLGDVDAESSGAFSGSLAGVDGDASGTFSGSLGDDDSDSATGDGDGAAEFALTFPTVSSEATGLIGAVEYVQALVTYLTDLADTRSVLPVADELATSLELARKQLTDAGVSGPAVDLIAGIQDGVVVALDALRTAFDRSADATEHAAATLGELEQYTRLRQSYLEVGGEAGEPSWYQHE